MRTFVVVITIFAIPFGVLSYLGRIDPLGQARPSQDLVNEWLASQRDGLPGGRYWVNSSDPAEISRLIRWEFLEASVPQVKARLWLEDQQEQSLPPADYLFRIEVIDGGSVVSPRRKITQVSNLTDPLSKRARAVMNHVESWLVSQRDGTDDHGFWASEAEVVKVDGIVAWQVMKPPTGSAKTTLDLVIVTRNADGTLQESTWNVGVQQQGDGAGIQFQPKITRATNLSD